MTHEHRGHAPVRAITAAHGTGLVALVSRPIVQASLLLIVCIALFWIGLGYSGFSATEGHRVTPAWDMLRSGDWLVPRMFEQEYLRKPPGMPWAIAASSALLGETEFAARAVSALCATLAVMLTWAAATRWFGSPWGFFAGLAHALTPLFWASARSAEIEALNNLCTQAAVFALVSLLVPRDDRALRRWSLALCAALAMAGAAAAKGPASAFILPAILLAPCLLSRSLAPLRRIDLWAALGLTALLSAGIAYVVFFAAVAAPGSSIVQTPAEFLWNITRLPQVFLLAPIALISALPISIALAFPWGPDARRESFIEWPLHQGPELPRPLRIARTLAAACLLSLAIAVLLGISNPRYTMPALTFIAPLVAYTLRGWRHVFRDTRCLALRLSTLGSPAVLAALIVILAPIQIVRFERSRAQESGKDAGAMIAQHLTDKSELWAGDLVEARPEVLLYARAAAERAGLSVRFRWIQAAPPYGPAIPPPGGFVAFRSDNKSGELVPLRDAGLLDKLETVVSAHVHKYAFSLMRVRKQ